MVPQSGTISGRRSRRPGGHHYGLKGQNTGMRAVATSQRMRSASSKVATAVSIMSFVYDNPESFPKYRENITEALPRFEEQMEPQTFTTAWEKGKELDFETAVEMLRTALKQN